VATIIPTNINFLEYARFLGKQESQELRWASDFKLDLEHLAEHGQQIHGSILPYSDLVDKFRTKPGELTVWAGWSGHFKSTVVGQVMLEFAKTERVCVASLEMPPPITLLRMATQAAGCSPSKEFASKFSDWSDGRILIYDQLDKVAAERILGMVVYAREELKCDHVVIDSLTKCGLPSDGNGHLTQQVEFIDRLQWIAKNTGVQIHLVCHCRKGELQRELQPPTKFDIRGASQISDMADNVVMVFKNKLREKALRKRDFNNANPHLANPLNEKELEQIDKRPDQLLIVEKQRNFGWEGAQRLYLQPEALQFTEVEGKRYEAIL